MRGEPQKQQNPQGYMQEHQGRTQNYYTAPSNGQSEPVPAVSYINPAFLPFTTAPQLQWSAPVQLPTNPMAYTQAMSTLMASNAATQSMNATVGDVPQEQSSPYDQYYNDRDVSSPQFTGKRKRGSSNAYPDRNTSPNHNRNKPQQRPSKVKTDVGPSVPSFGFALPTVLQPPQVAVSNGDNAISSRRRKFNQLGLTPRGEDRENSDEEVDEEAVFGHVGPPGGGLVFEYNGQTAALNSPSDIAAWIAERKKRFPTSARIQEKVKEQALKRLHEQEAIRCVKGQAEANRRSKLDTQVSVNNIKPSVESGDEKKRKAIERQMKKVEKLRKKLKKSEKKAARTAGALVDGSDVLENTSGTVFEVNRDDATSTGLLPLYRTPKSAPQVKAESSLESQSLDGNNQIRMESKEFAPTPGFGSLQEQGESKEPSSLAIPGRVVSKVDLGIKYSSDTDVSNHDMNSDASSTTSSSDQNSDSDSSSSGSEADDMDSAPEELSAKTNRPIRAPPTKANVTPRTFEPSICPSYKRTGRCAYGNRCRFPHPPRDASREVKPKRKHLYDRLVEQEQEAAEKLALQAIKYLGGNGFLT